jgi:NAD(P)H dehydrogenase (quinone)
MSGKLLMVTGAGGALGRLVIGELVAAGQHPVAGTRHPQAQSIAGLELRRVDFDDAPSLQDSFRRVDRALFVSTDELASPGKRQRQHQAAIDAAARAGVSYIAYTSMPNPTSSPAIFFAPDHAATEAALADSGIAHGVLRNGWYQENLLAYLPNIIADGTWFTAAGMGRMPQVARIDAARAAAALLATGETGVFDIAGPQALTIDDIAAAVRDVLGCPLGVAHVDDARLATELERQGIAAPVIPMVLATEANQRAGRFDVGPGAVERLTGRPPEGIHDFLRAHVDALLAARR